MIIKINADIIAKKMEEQFRSRYIRTTFILLKEEDEILAHLEVAYLNCLFKNLIDEYYNKYEMMSIGSAIDVLKDDGRLPNDFGQCDILYNYGWVKGENDIYDYHFEYDNFSKQIILRISKPVKLDKGITTIYVDNAPFIKFDKNGKLL